MKIAERIFKRNDYYITSPFGYRTRNGKKEFHNGCDYGTNRQKWKQYAIEDGKVLSVAKSTIAGNTLEILYPRLDRISRHIHLDKIHVKKGQKVDNNTHIADTGMTGSGVTGIHLHLAWINPKTREHLDPEKYDYQEYVAPVEVDLFPGITDEELARRVWLGEFGNGKDRVNALGIRYKGVQALVNKGIGKQDKPKPTKSIDELAKEVINGKWGNGQERKDKLTNAGYDYKEVQDRVNEMLKQDKPKTYIVKRGDTLYGIAKDNNINMMDLYAKNKKLIDSENKRRGVNINRLWIYPGQLLKLD